MVGPYKLPRLGFGRLRNNNPRRLKRESKGPTQTESFVFEIFLPGQKQQDRDISFL